MRNGKFRVSILMIVCIFSLVIAAQSAMARKELSYKEKKKVDHTMRMLQMNTENLHIAFEKKDWKEIENLALSIHDACAGLEFQRNTDIPPEFDDFKIFSENMHDYAQEIVDASKKKDIEKAKIAYKDMEKTCVDCHRLFRK